jgi:cold shock CspA family protein
MTDERKSGVVKFWNDNRGYGFVTTDDYRDLFLHHSQWVEEDSNQSGVACGQSGQRKSPDRVSGRGFYLRSAQMRRTRGAAGSNQSLRDDRAPKDDLIQV